MKKIMVTICCITYNQEDYLRDTLDGFLKQKTNFDYEIIIHDDASTDNTVKIIKEYVKKYPNIFKPILQKQNQYSKGIVVEPMLYKMAQGKYVTICEGDDYWTDPNKLQCQVDYMEKHDKCSFIFHNADVLDVETGMIRTFVPNDIEERKYIKKSGNYDVGELELLGFIPTASFMFRRKHVDKLPEWFDKVFVGDWPLKLVMTSFGYAHFINKNMCVYRKNAKGSVTVENTKKENNSIKERKKMLDNKIFLLNNIDEFTDYKFHTIFNNQIIIYKVDYLLQTKQGLRIIKEGYLKHFSFSKRIKLYLKIFFPSLSKKLIKIKKKVLE